MVSSDEDVRGQRFPMIAVVPLTRARGQGLLYPRTSAGTGELTTDSHALTDQVRSVDKRRDVRLPGKLNAQQVEAVDDGLEAFLEL